MSPTFALDKVKVELMQRRHRHRLDVVVSEKVLHAVGDVLARRHARRLSDFLLQEEERYEMYSTWTRGLKTTQDQYL